MKELKCDECGAVVIRLAKGSKFKPNIYVLHEACPTKERKANESFTPEEQANLDHIKDMLGIG